MNQIQNIRQLEALIEQTYMFAIILSLLALVLALVIAKIIKYGGKNSRDHIKRLIWYIVVGFAAPIGFYLYNFFFVMDSITKPPLVAKFSSANILATLLVIGIYLVLGVITMVLFRKSKWGSIINKHIK